MKLSAAARIALRKTITNNPRWDDYRKSNNLSLATMSRDDYFRSARDMGIDVVEIARRADNETTAEIPAREVVRVNSEHLVKTDKARDAIRVFSDEDEHKAEQFQDENEDERRVKAKRDRDDATRDAVKAVATDDKAHALLRLISDIAGNSVNADDVRAIVRAELENHQTETGQVVRIELERQGKFTGKVDGHQHPKFATLLRVATARDVSGYCLNVWLSGPAGSGKTFSVSMVAKALECPFHYNGAIGMAHELLGFVDGNGFYHRTAFREAYEHGGCYLFDEVDGSDNAALLALNAALANGTATFPDGVVTRHKDCRIFAAANTWGFGGTADYVGRSKIDAAFLSRFPVRIHWEYDERLEQAICGNAEFAERVQRARAGAKSAGLKILITPRDSIAGSALTSVGFTAQEAAELTYLAPLTPEQRRMVGS